MNNKISDCMSQNRLIMFVPVSFAYGTRLVHPATTTLWPETLAWWVKPKAALAVVPLHLDLYYQPVRSAVPCRVVTPAPWFLEAM